MYVDYVERCGLIICVGRSVGENECKVSVGSGAGMVKSVKKC